MYVAKKSQPHINPECSLALTNPLAFLMNKVWIRQWMAAIKPHRVDKVVRSLALQDEQLVKNIDHKKKREEFISYVSLFKNQEAHLEQGEGEAATDVEALSHSKSAAEAREGPHRRSSLEVNSLATAAQSVVRLRLFDFSTTLINFQGNRKLMLDMIESTVNLLDSRLILELEQAMHDFNLNRVQDAARLVLQITEMVASTKIHENAEVLLECLCEATSPENTDEVRPNDANPPMLEHTLE